MTRSPIFLAKDSVPLTNKVDTEDNQLYFSSDPEVDRYIRRVSYLKATKEERSQPDSDQEETDQSKIQDLDQSKIQETDQSKIQGAEEGSKEQGPLT